MSAVTLPTLNKVRSRTDLVQLIQTADRGGLTREPGWPWEAYCINGVPKPEIRPAVGQLIKDEFLVDPTPNAPKSTIRPTKTGLAKIGVTR